MKILATLPSNLFKAYRKFGGNNKRYYIRLKCFLTTNYH